MPEIHGAREHRKSSGKSSESPVVNIADNLSLMAKENGKKTALIYPKGQGRSKRNNYQSLTFDQLDREINRYAHGLNSVGITRGKRTIMMVRPGLEFVAISFALFRVSAVPVLIDPGMGLKNMADSLACVKAGAFIGIPMAHLLRKFYPKSFRTIETSITVGRRWFWGGKRLRDIRAESYMQYRSAPARENIPAAIFFTSGSTGPPKGVVYDHAMFASQLNYLKSHFCYSKEESDLATFPLFVLFDMALGMTAVLPEMDYSRPGSADPRRIVETINKHECTQMFASPALLDRIARYGEMTGINLPTLKRVITAGAPIRPALLASVRKMLSGDAEIHTPYGATEALPVTDIDGWEILDETRELTARGDGTCVGRPLKGMEVKIIHIEDGPISKRKKVRELTAGSIGEIIVKGPVVSRRYFNLPEANALSKIEDNDGRVWHRMGDVGKKDELGRLWFCGRKSHRVITKKGTLFTVACESVFNQHPRVFRTALVGIGEAGKKEPVLCVEREPDDSGKNKDQLTRELLAIGASNSLTSNIKTILYRREFPVDVRHNAKIFRDKLAIWASGVLK